VNDILVENVDIIAPTYAGVELRGYGHAYAPAGERVSDEYLTAADNAKYTNITLRNVHIYNAGTYGIEVLDNATRGQVTFDGVSVTGSMTAPLLQGGAPDAFFHRVGSNPGWDVGGGGGGPADAGVPDAAAGGVNLALHHDAESSSSNPPYTPANVVDGDASSYWESASNAYPQTLTVDLGATRSIDEIVLALPGAWGARAQTLSVLGSTDGTSFTTVVAASAVAFDTARGNLATLHFGATSVRYVQLRFTANTGWPAGQLAELEVYGP
jgi:hypothetical protein